MTEAKGTGGNAEDSRTRSGVEAFHAAQPPMQVATGTETLLAVEDDYVARYSLVRTLDACGYRVHAASGVEEALDLWRSHSASIAALVTDIVMPRGGEVLARALVAEKPSLKVLFVTGYGEAALVRLGDLRNRAQVEHVGKPWDPLDLLRVLRDLLDEKGEDGGEA